MKSIIPKANILSFTEFQTFFNMERFIDRGIPVIITFNTEDEYSLLLGAKKAILDTLYPHSLQQQQQQQSGSSILPGATFPTDHNDESFQSRLLESTRKATNFLLSESLFTMPLMDFLTPIRNVRRNFIIDKSPCQQILEFNSGEVSPGGAGANTIPLSMSKLFSMQISVVIEDFCRGDGDSSSSSGGSSENGVIWETARTKQFSDKYISHDIYVEDFCGVFKSKSVYTFVQSPREVVIFPPSCARQGKVEGRAIRKVVMWSVHNIVSLSLNSIIKDFSPTKILDKKVALKQSIKHFIVSAITQKQKQLTKIRSHLKLFDYFIEALLLLENMCDLMDLNFGVHLCSFEDVVPKVYALGRSYSACSCCCESIYGTGFFRKQARKDEYICFNCLARMKDELDDIVEVVFLDPKLNMSSIEDRELLLRFHNSLLSKFSFDAQLLNVLEVSQKILPPFSDTFYLNCNMRPQAPYKSVPENRSDIWNHWEVYFQEKIWANPKISDILKSKEGLYRLCIPIERFYGSPIMFILLVVHSFQKSEVDALANELHIDYAFQPCAYTQFLLGVVECNSFGLYRTYEKDKITLKLLGPEETKGSSQIISSSFPTSVILDGDKLNRLCVFDEKSIKSEKRRLIGGIVSKTHGDTPLSMPTFSEFSKRMPPAKAPQPPAKRCCFDIPKRVSTPATLCDDGWLKKYVSTRLYLSKDAIMRVQDTQLCAFWGTRFVTEQYAIDDKFTINIDNFFIDSNKRNNTFFTEFKESIEFTSKIHLILSEVLPKVKSFSVSLKKTAGTKPRGSNESSEDDEYSGNNVVIFFKKELMEENCYCTEKMQMQNVEEFSLILFYKLLMTINSKTGRLLLLDVISSECKEMYGWSSFGCTGFPVLPFKKSSLFDVLHSVDIFGTKSL